MVPPLPWYLPSRVAFVRELPAGRTKVSGGKGSKSSYGGRKFSIYQASHADTELPHSRLCVVFSTVNLNTGAIS
jgi:hypothetical protein